MSQFFIPSLDDIGRAAQEILKVLPPNATVCLYGEMGVGKTTLVAAMCRALGVTDSVVSPTFAIVNEYCTPEGGIIYHFDFYRINSLSEVFDFGYEEYFFRENGLCFIEWPELVEELLPPQGVIRLYLTLRSDGSRVVELR